jgi:acetyl-CoA carboxylase biotin carboxyl carrier protein
MNQKEIHDLIKIINKTDISEFRLKDKDFSILIRTNDYVKNNGTTILSGTPQMAAPAVSSAPAPLAQVAPVASATDAPVEAKSEENPNFITFKSPIVGTFYRKSSPDKDAFVKVDEVVSVGTVICVIEAMKLFNEIESEISGRIVKVLVDDATPVEYDQPLFIIDPS